MGLNLLKYFTSRDEHLPASYVKKCKKFLGEIKKKRKKRQAASVKPEDLHAANTTSFKHQAPSSKRLKMNTIIK